MIVDLSLNFTLIRNESGLDCFYLIRPFISASIITRTRFFFSGRTLYDGLQVKDFVMTDELLAVISGGEKHDTYDILP